MARKGHDLAEWAGSLTSYKEGELAKKDVLLVLNIVDDSSSIKAMHNTQHVIDGYQAFLKGIKDAPGDIRVGTIFLNGDLELKFVPAAKAPGLAPLGYAPHGDTPLYKRVADGLFELTKEVRRLTQLDCTVRTMVFIFTDGNDNASGSFTAANIYPVVVALISTQMHIVAGCGVWDGCTNFRQVFAMMGIPEEWIKVLSDGQSIRDTFEEMGTSTSMASRNLESFTQVSQTGFVKPPSSDSGSGSSSSSRRKKPKP